MNTFDFTVKITGVPEKEFESFKNEITPRFRKKFGSSFSVKKEIQITFEQCQHFTNLEAFFEILSNAVTVDAMAQEVKQQADA